MSVLLDVWGDYACFSRPELKTERYTYDVMTPGAAIGILEAIFWHPGMHYKIDKIYVLNPIAFMTIWRNEVKSKISARKVNSAIEANDLSDLYNDRADDIVQRSSTILENVHYIIKAHFDIGEEANETDNPGKFQDILTRRIKRGQCYHRPYFGVREFPVQFKMWDKREQDIKTAYENETLDLGIMLYKMEYTPVKAKDGTTVYKAEPTYFRAKLEDGVLDLENCEVLR